MSLTGALSNALSGLNAAARNAQVTASNLANVGTEGYGRRELELGSRTIGSGGVRIVGITRHAATALIAERRDATSEQAETTRLASYFARLEGLVGTPADGDSLSAHVADFEASLVSAASRPDLNERLQSVVTEAKDLAAGFEKASDGIQSMRSEADMEIAAEVARLNTSLQQLRELNLKMSSAVVHKRDTSAIEDQRQLVIDAISEIVPIKQVSRDLGQIALYTPGGAILIDGPPAELDFTATNIIVPHMTLASGDLSGLTINGNSLSTRAEGGPISGGRLSALFQIRDELTVEAQAQLDAVARDMVERFQDPALDASRLPGDPGLFTDSGAAFVSTDEVGLAGRIEVNARVDASAGGESWRIRDGLGAASPGAPGNSQLLQDLGGALTQLRIPASGNFGSSAHSSSMLQASFLAEIGIARNVSEQAVTFANTQWDSINTKVLEEGVDSDMEMQRLMLIEQAYAANARMMEVIDDMMQRLMSI